MSQIVELELAQSIQIAVNGNASLDLQTGLLTFAAFYIEKGETQLGADILAYLLHHQTTESTIAELAQDHWDALATWICPSVLYDAAYFGRNASLNDVLEAVNNRINKA